ncbi:phage protein Gp36 family protein [Methylomagnum sp.]
MAYATQADMEERYPLEELIQRTNLDDPDATAIASSVLNRALEDASLEVDDYIDPTALPIDLDTLVPTSRARLALLCCRIARKNLYFDAPPSDNKPQWRLDYEAALDTLKRHQNGETSLLRYLEAPAANGLGQVRTAGNDRVFTRRRLGDM